MRLRSSLHLLPCLALTAGCAARAVTGPMVPASWTAGPAPTPVEAPVAPVTPTADFQLPDGTFKTRGGIRALVFPVSLGLHRPLWTDTLIARRVVGTANRADGSAPQGAAGRLFAASRGLFRLEASVFPGLVDALTTDSASAAAALTPEGLTALATRVVTTWGYQTNLASFDNDGADGQPMSGDDDGELDCVVLAVEADGPPAALVVPIDVVLPAGQDGQLRVTVHRVVVLALPRDGGTPDLRPAILAAMGLGLDEASDAPVGEGLSTIATVRLGWAPVRPAGRSGIYTADASDVLQVPVVDVPGGRAFWLLETGTTSARLSRVVRQADGRLVPTAVEHLTKGAPALLVPLTQTEGATGPRMRVLWPAGDGPTAIVSLTARAAREDDAALPGLAP